MKTDLTERITPDNVTELMPGQIFVFGSNLKGNHCGDAAFIAEKKFGAIMGEAIGLQGSCYAIPTIGIYGQPLDLSSIQFGVSKFIEYAKQFPALTFLVTPIGCGIAGHKPLEIAPFFKDAIHVQNIYLPRGFLSVLK